MAMFVNLVSLVAVHAQLLQLAVLVIQLEIMSLREALADALMDTSKMEQCVNNVLLVAVFVLQ